MANLCHETSRVLALIEAVTFSNPSGHASTDTTGAYWQK